MKNALKALASQIALCLMAGAWVGLVAGVVILALWQVIGGPASFVLGMGAGILSIGVPFKLFSR